MNHNLRKQLLTLVRVVVITICMYCFFVPTALARGGYDLAINGIVIARTACLLFALYQAIQLIKDFL